MVAYYWSYNSWQLVLYNTVSHFLYYHVFCLRWCNLRIRVLFPKMKLRLSRCHETSRTLVGHFEQPHTVYKTSWYRAQFCQKICYFPDKSVSAGGLTPLNASTCAYVIVNNFWSHVYTVAALSWQLHDQHGAVQCNATSLMRGQTFIHNRQLRAQINVTYIKTMT